MIPSGNAAPFLCFTAEHMSQPERTILEATIAKAPTGKEWEVTIIGAQSPDDLLTVDGKKISPVQVYRKIQPVKVAMLAKESLPE